ncbi:MAG: hypothetical protein M1831_003862 [Alyxoria varia]|nr:MAG: hypothetical protein M1831_003862 [Alyxoria varia]
MKYPMRGTATNAEPFTFINSDNVQSSEDSHSLFPTYKHLNRAPIADTDVQLQAALREKYPELTLTATPASNSPLLQFAAIGEATATLDTDNDDVVRWRGYIAPAHRGQPGAIGDAVFFAKYNYHWAGEDFIVYGVGSGFSQILYVLKEPDQSAGEDPKGHCAKVDALMKAAVLTLVGDENKYIYVYDGYWSRSRELYEEVQKSSWDNVILGEKMKKALQTVSSKFFDSKDIYDRYGVPWKRGLIFHGPAGNGKTISIKALMKTLSQRKNPVPTLYVKSAPYTYDIHQVFEEARRMSPCLLVLEDIETIVTSDTRSYFFNEVDGLQGNNGILMVASTNYLERLDPGLSKRPSRFDRKYLFPLPDHHERILYAQFWKGKIAKEEAFVTAPIPFPDKLCPAIADITHGFSFAFLQEAFVATLLAIARESSDDEIEEDGYEGCEDVADLADRMERAAVFPWRGKRDHHGDKSHPELDGYKLWRVFKVQVRMLREDMDHSPDDGPPKPRPAFPGAGYQGDDNGDNPVGKHNDASLSGPALPGQKAPRVRPERQPKELDPSSSGPYIPGQRVPKYRPERRPKESSGRAGAGSGPRVNQAAQETSQGVLQARELGMSLGAYPQQNQTFHDGPFDLCPEDLKTKSQMPYYSGKLPSWTSYRPGVGLGGGLAAGSGLGSNPCGASKPADRRTKPESQVDHTDSAALPSGDILFGQYQPPISFPVRNGDGVKASAFNHPGPHFGADVSQGFDIDSYLLMNMDEQNANHKPNQDTMCQRHTPDASKRTGSQVDRELQNRFGIPPRNPPQAKRMEPNLNDPLWYFHLDKDIGSYKDTMDKHRKDLNTGTNAAQMEAEAGLSKALDFDTLSSPLPSQQYAGFVDPGYAHPNLNPANTGQLHHKGKQQPDSGSPKLTDTPSHPTSIPAANISGREDSNNPNRPAPVAEDLETTKTCLMDQIARLKRDLFVEWCPRDGLRSLTWGQREKDMKTRIVDQVAKARCQHHLPGTWCPCHGSNESRLPFHESGETKDPLVVQVEKAIKKQRMSRMASSSLRQQDLADAWAPHSNRSKNSVQEGEQASSATNADRNSRESDPQTVAGASSSAAVTKKDRVATSEEMKDKGLVKSTNFADTAFTWGKYS